MKATNWDKRMFEDLVDYTERNKKLVDKVNQRNKQIKHLKDRIRELEKKQNCIICGEKMTMPNHHAKCS